MARWVNREAKIRQNPKQVRFSDLDAVMRMHGFNGDADAHHVVYKHSRFTDLTTNVPKPHGGTIHVKTIYVRNAIALIDAATVRETEAQR